MPSRSEESAARDSSPSAQNDEFLEVSNCSDFANSLTAKNTGKAFATAMAQAQVSIFANAKDESADRKWINSAICAILRSCCRNLQASEAKLNAACSFANSIVCTICRNLLAAAGQFATCSNYRIFSVSQAKQVVSYNLAKHGIENLSLEVSHV